jgi:hypothetical protein
LDHFGEEPDGSMRQRVHVAAVMRQRQLQAIPIDERYHDDGSLR